MRLRVFLITNLLLLSASLMQARDLMHFEQYSTSDGLPNNRISSICEDEEGNVWFSTWDGLCRWDGKHMKGFNETSDNKTMGRVRNVRLIDNGCLVYQDDDRIQHCFDPRECEPRPLPETFAFQPDRTSEATYEEDATGLRILRHGVVYRIPYAEGVREEAQLHSFYEDRKGQIWLDLNNSLYRVWFEPSPFFHYKVWPHSPYMPFRATLRSLCCSPSGSLLAASRNYQLFGTRDSVLQLPGNAYAMQVDGSNRLWLALRKKGLYMWTPQEGLHPAIEDLARAGLTDLFSMAILKDSCYLWAGTWGNGVRILDISEEVPTMKRTLLNDSLTSVHQIIQFHDDRVGLCSTRGLHIYSPSGNSLSAFETDYDVLSAIQLSNSDVLFSTMGHGLFRVKSDGSCLADKGFDIQERIVSMYQTGSFVWLVSDSRLYCYNEVAEKLEIMDERDFGESIFFAESSITLCQDSLLYIGASVGMLEINVNEIESYLQKRAVQRKDALMRRVLYVVNIFVAILLLVGVIMWFTWRRAKQRSQDPLLLRLNAEATSRSIEDKMFVQQLTEVLNRMIGQSDADIAAVAEQMKLTRNVLYVRCSEVLHSTPAAMLQELRMDYARQLITEGVTSIKEIATQSGFNDPKYFSKVFKARYKMTPSQYVAEYNKKNKHKNEGA